MILPLISELPFLEIPLSPLLGKGEVAFPPFFKEGLGGIFLGSISHSTIAIALLNTTLFSTLAWTMYPLSLFHPSVVNVSLG